jgi:hypothetical protein
MIRWLCNKLVTYYSAFPYKPQNKTSTTLEVKYRLKSSHANVFKKDKHKSSIARTVLALLGCFLRAITSLQQTSVTTFIFSV